MKDFGKKLSKLQNTDFLLTDSPLISGLLAIFHVLFIFMVWSFFQTMITDPGQVPPFWVSFTFAYNCLKGILLR